MAEKKYYWLKMTDQFFEDKAIKKLRKIAGGDTYTIIYLKMLLTAIKQGKIEEDITSRERSKLRDRLLQSHRYFTSPEKNPLHAWSEMEADAFWSMFKEYENAKGNGHMHTVVQPELRALEVIPMHEDAKIAELMGSRK